MFIFFLNEGGFGNSLFQLSLAKYLKNNGIKKKIWFINSKKDQSYTYEAIKDSNFSQIPDVTIQINHIVFKLLKYFLKFLNLIKIIQIADDDTNLEDLVKFSFFMGYFQNKIFAECVNQELSELVKLYLNTEDNELLSHVKSKDAVVIHFRLGDYNSNKRVNLFHGLCQPDYFKSAVNNFNIPITKIILFSDDIKLAKKLIGDYFTLPKIMTINNEISFLEEFATMAVSKNIIISNSTFSWWAAFHNNKNCVISPTPWVNDKKTNIKLERNLYNSGWKYLNKNTGS